MWVLTVVLLVVLVGASAFFSSSETALLSISKIHLRQMVKDRMPGAKRVSALKSDMDRLLTTILIGNNFVNNLASSAATALAVDLFGQGGVGAATVAMTIIIIMFGMLSCVIRVLLQLFLMNCIRISIRAYLLMYL